MRGQLAPVESSDSLPSGRAMNISTQTACLEGQLQSYSAPSDSLRAGLVNVRVQSGALSVLDSQLTCHMQSGHACQSNRSSLEEELCS